MKTNNKKIILIPGWLNTLETYKKYDGLEIWNEEKFNLEILKDADYIIAHSMGAIFTLLHWTQDIPAKIILVNPLFPKRHWIKWLLRLLKFHLFDNRYPKILVAGLIKKLRGIKKCISMLKSDTTDLLNNISKENIIILRGKEDYYFCDSVACELIREKGIQLIEVDGVGHDWNEKFDEEVKRIVNSK